MKALIVIATLFALPANACPIVVDVDGKNAAMLDRLSRTMDYSASQRAVNQIWRYWQTAPDAQAQEWLDEGLSRIRQMDLENAQSVLQALVEYCPDYAEGHNQLAFAQFLAGDYDASEASLKRTLELEPRHFGAIAGMGLIAHQRGNLGAAKIWIKKAVAVHPFLNERFILDIPSGGDAL